MVRVKVAEFLPDGSGKKHVELAGLSTDAKPKKKVYATGSFFFEVDTGDLYAYDETGDGTWNKVAELGGGS